MNGSAEAGIPEKIVGGNKPYNSATWNLRTVRVKKTMAGGPKTPNRFIKNRSSSLLAVNIYLKQCH